MQRSTTNASCLAAVFGLVVVVGGCGARSTLEGQPGEDGAGASSGSATGEPSTQASATASGSSSTGVVASCPAFHLVDPVIVAETPSVVTDGRLGLRAEGDVVLAWLAPDASLYASLIAPFDSWPPAFPWLELLLPGVTSFSFGGGGSDPHLHITSTDGSDFISYQAWPNLILMDTSPSFGRSLFVANVDLAWLFGEADGLGAVVTRSLDFFSVAVVREEGPPACSARPLAAAVRVGDALLSAMADNRSAPFCDVGKAWPDWITTTRYDYFDGASDSLVPSTSESWHAGEPFASLAMTPTSSGAWIVFQSDGSTGFGPPPIFAYRIGEDGRGVDVSPSVKVSSPGASVGVLGAAAMGDAVAVAYAVSDSAGGPARLAVQRVEADGTLGPSVDVPTHLPPSSERLDLVASRDAGKLLLGWQTNDDSYVLARIDCVAP